ncbi:MAG: preprotein translocase subunit TatA [Bdellovibrionales bacterium RIFCSPHIGHO2_01_FULL_40_29]|nr:MAG: preprotein translocase subunit TatA [Bdellovibrionales bacterium RIFCSPHIGHO2_01_FULL_40_29]OFZ34412.1 MAG: preprotein translocase subunit TatA [Bdellovibrionales bacterium RIFCSPHIGHO2_02_FULL_40_15]
MGEFSIAHLLILTVILLIFFGPSRLPALGQSIGKAIKGFKQGLSEIDAEVKDVSPQNQLNQSQQAMNQENKVDSKVEKK